jgi:glutamyl-tRNA synthetase
MTVRTRMAPSPTGDYHIGHIRTVLYNYAFAKKNDGQFLLRIEDTDRNRYVDGATERILNDIESYGFSWDEGPRIGGEHGPYIQSERLPLYKEKALELVEKGKAYYCFCSKDRLAELRESQQAQGMPSTKYDKHCLSLSPKEVHEKLSAGDSYVIRLDVPKDREISFDDIAYGKVTINSNDLDDQVLLKSDGFPTYHLAVVVDDHLMKVTHIMRGMDWLPSTPKHVLLYEAFGWEMPVLVHLPNLKELGGSRKLSKRFGSVFASEFLKEGYLPEAIVNFLMFLGWNPGTEREMYTLEEFVVDFSLDRLQKTDLVSFDRKKLLWYNGQYIRNMPAEDLYVRLVAWAEKYEVILNGSSVGSSTPMNFDVAYTVKVLGLVQDRLTVLNDFNELTGYFFSDPEVDEKLRHKFSKSPERTAEILKAFVSAFENVTKDNWTVANLEKICGAVLEKDNFTPKEAYMTLRAALTGRKASPHIFDVLGVLGKTVVLHRLGRVL